EVVDLCDSSSSSSVGLGYGSDDDVLECHEDGFAVMKSSRAGTDTRGLPYESDEEELDEITVVECRNGEGGGNWLNKHKGAKDPKAGGAEKTKNA
ncbi:hypothetical protein TrRE_jg9647, partial [Triparma retinervis]